MIIYWFIYLFFYHSNENEMFVYVCLLFYAAYMENSFPVFLVTIYPIHCHKLQFNVM